MAIVTFSNLTTLIDRTDRTIRKREDVAVAILHRAITKSFDNLELELRRLYPDALGDSTLINRSQNAASLLRQLNAAMVVLDPDQAKEATKTMDKLFSDAQALGVDVSAKSVEMVDPVGVTFRPRIPIEVAAVAAEQAVNRLERHGKDFALKASSAITEGILQRWSIAQTVKALRVSTDIGKSQAEMIVRTETLSAYNAGVEIFCDENKIEYVMRYVTADDRTCLVCVGRSGEITKLGKERATLHPRCRCYFTPFQKAWVKAGVFDLKAVVAQTQAVRDAHETPEKLNSSRLAPFEKGLEKRLPVLWRPGMEMPFQSNAKQASPDGSTPEPVSQGGPSKSDPQSSYKRLIEKGEQIAHPMAKRLVDIDLELDNAKAAFNMADIKLDRAAIKFGDDVGALFKSDAGIAYDLASDRLFRVQGIRNTELLESMSGIRSDLISANAVDPDASKVKINKGATKDLSEADIRASIETFSRMTGGRGSRLLAKVVMDDDRAWADDETGELNIGSHGGAAEKAVKTLFHEMGHFLEFEDPKIANAANEWIRSRATGKLTSLREAMPQFDYGEDEMHYPDHFIDPYVGKVYSDRTTEVISMGMEYLASPVKMVELYNADPGHFHLILGVLKND